LEENSGDAVTHHIAKAGGGLEEIRLNVSPWLLLVAALPVLWLGERMVRSWKLLGRLNIPAPVASGLVLSLLVLAGNMTGYWSARFDTQVSAPWWTWLVSTEGEWAKVPVKGITLPLLVGFFTCIGLNASWRLVKKGSGHVVLFLGLAALLAVLQNVLGVLLAKLLGVTGLLGLVCGSVTLTGGHGTALGFAGELEKAGLAGAAEAGVAAATFGLVAGALLGGPLAGRLITRYKLESAAPANTHLEAGQTGHPGILNDFRALWGFGRSTVLHVVLILGLIKLGAYASAFLQKAGITFPVYMGAMLLGVVLRNVVDAVGGRWIRTEVVDTVGSVLLGFFLSMAMMSLNLVELAHVAGPMLVILSVQVVLMAAFARYVTFPALGRDFDAAVMAGGHCGFGMGATANAVATMKTLVDSFGPSPKAFLVVPMVGAFLIDLVNALNITLFLNLLK
jgi:ESS family glutamate:Na+ symporter